MKLSRESEYGIQGLIHLAQQPSGTVMQLAAIAEAQGLPQSFLAKIFQKFSQYGLGRSFRSDLHQPVPANAPSLHRRPPARPDPPRLPAARQAPRPPLAARRLGCAVPVAGPGKP